MHRLFTLAVAGLAAGWLMLATPSTSQAQGVSFGFQFQRGGGYYGGSPGYYRGGYGGYGAYAPYSGRYYGGSGYYGGYGRPAIVHPEYRHWTPNRGWHDHGHIHVPHRGHYHTYRY
jgi:hypothetical protein